MENKEQETPSQSQEEVTSTENKNKLSEEKKNKDEKDLKTPNRGVAEKAGQEKFINEIEKTENLIDPGNEHQHHANEIDKNIG